MLYIRNVKCHPNIKRTTESTTERCSVFIMNSIFVICCLLIGVVVITTIDVVNGHGMLLEPVGRASRWRFDSSAPANYDDNGVNCGGYGVSYRTLLISYIYLNYNPHVDSNGSQ